MSKVTNKDVEVMIASYDKHKSLKVVSEDTGIPWQTVYWHLKRVGVQVTGDKRRYGSDKDKMAAKYEDIFLATVPYATPNNSTEFQSKYDFSIGSVNIDVKSATLSNSSNRAGRINNRWSFSISKDVGADYLVLYCLNGDVMDNCIHKILLIPNEFSSDKQTISVSPNHSKWFEFEVSSGELRDFFDLIRS